MATYNIIELKGSERVVVKTFEAVDQSDKDDVFYAEHAKQPGRNLVVCDGNSEPADVVETAPVAAGKSKSPK